MESLSVNSANLEKQLADQSISAGEIKRFVDVVSQMYSENVDGIVQECSRDVMALERVPSPLKLFVDCLFQVQKSMSVSPPTRALVQRYTSAWEDWM